MPSITLPLKSSFRPVEAKTNRGADEGQFPQDPRGAFAPVRTMDRRLEHYEDWRTLPMTEYEEDDDQTDFTKPEKKDKIKRTIRRIKKQSILSSTEMR